MLQNQAKFAGEHNKDEVLEGKFRNLTFSPSTKKDNSAFFLTFSFNL